MANITLLGASYTDVPAVDLPKTGGGTVRFYEAPTYTATISGTGSTYTFIEYDNATYYTDGDFFEFAEGDTIRIRVEGMRAGGSIVIDGVTVAQDHYNAVSYYYTAPASDIAISLSYSSEGSATVETQSPVSITVEPLSVTTNGTYTAPSGTAYSPVTVNVPSGSPTLQAKTASPTTSQQIITADSGYDGLSQVTISAMPSGTAGTPTATKGTVSNHSISVTPSVTNTAGYISGGTKTGTAVSVSASELVSGTYNITTSGTHDVTNYASASVTFSSIFTGSTEPQNWSDGDVWIKTV